MSHHYKNLGISAFLEGLFLAIQSKTGQDVSPSGIGLLILDAFEPLITPEIRPQIEFYKILIIIIPFAFTAWGIAVVGWKKGLIIFIPILIGSYLLFTVGV